MRNGDFRAETGDFRGFPREMACGNRKTSDFFDGKFRGFCHKHPMFYAKKSGVLGVPKGDFRCFHPLAPSIFSDMPQKNVHFHHTAMGKYTRNYQMNLRLQGLYGFGVSPKNIHTDYTDYMVGGVASKYIHTDYTDIWFRGVAKKHSHGLHGLYSCRLPSGWVVTTTGTTRRIRLTPQDRNAPNGAKGT